VSPRPWVGAVVVTADGRAFAGATDGRDGPHAEVVALRAATSAGADTRGATMYVTLEPCSHHGRTGPCADAVTGAVAIELVHQGSLYHDDVIDEAETRRGVPSVNARWSNIVAILAGDFLLARASALAARLGGDVAEILATTIAELCRGQVLELQHLFDVERSEEGYSSAIEGKTASLFGTSCRVGGMVSGLAEPTLDALTRYGFHLGMCFQIVDDVLDITATDAVLGKPAGQDLVEGVYTLPVIHAIAHCAPAVRERLREIVAHGDGAALPEVLAAIREHGSLEYSQQCALAYAQRADAALDTLPPGQWKQALVGLARYAIERRS